MYDNRYLSCVKSSWPEVCWIMDRKEKISKSGNFSICIPFSAAYSDTVKNLPPEKNLCELLCSSGERRFKNPKNVLETKRILKRLKLENKTMVSYHWKILKVNNRFGEVWIVPPNNEFVEIDVEAFLKPDYTLGFRASTTYLDLVRPLCQQYLEKKKNKKMKIGNDDDDDNLLEAPNEFQRNCSSSISVQLNGLNELFNISGLSLAKFETLSTSLGKTFGVLWIELDSDREVRFATYRDLSNVVSFQVELSSQIKWKELFDHIFVQRQIMAEKKKSILDPAIEFLKTVTRNDIHYSNYKKCLFKLEQCIDNFKVLVYSKNDFVLHGLKTQFCYYMFQRKPKGFRGVEMTTDAKNNLSVLKTKELTIFNFFNFMELDENEKTFLPPPVILVEKRKCLRFQAKQSNNQSTLSYVRERGIAQSRQLLLAWQNLGNLFLSQFKFDIYSIDVSSLSYLSYNSIWTLYTRSGGWYHHGLEKSKAFDREQLRSECIGGFSYSAGLRREANEPLRHAGDSELCKNIQACDVRSSYGFACSEMSSVKGFCQSFKWNEEKNALTLCDRVNRQFTFEFLSVFYTIHFLETKMNVKIKTVYSNFHQFGVFSVKKYPIDLAIVTEEGHLRLYQMDGDYAHGCRAGCRGLKSYVHNKPRLDLERESQARDDFVESWCRKMNSSMDNDFFCTYRVKTSCHHSPYFKSNLLEYFSSEPELQHLTSNYFSSGQISQDQLLFCSDDLTFLAVVEGYVPGDRPRNPLLIRRDENNSEWERSGRTPEGGLFLTRDYLKWIIGQFNFQVTRINKVWVYKKCKLFNVIFKHLIEQRSLDSTGQSQKEFLKSVVNYCSGYFGLNETKMKTKITHRLVTKLSKRYNPLTTEIKPVGSVGNVDFLILSKHFSRGQKRTSNHPLPIYCLITEFGKMTLSKVMCHYETFLQRDKFMFVYSNIDNLVVILSTDDIEEAVDPSLRQKFKSCQEKLFGAKPGQLKKEFEFLSGDSWRFVSSMPQNYAVLTADSLKNVHKNNGWNATSSEASFAAACDILDRRKVQIQQERRVDKIKNTNTVLKTFCF